MKNKHLYFKKIKGFYLLMLSLVFVTGCTAPKASDVISRIETTINQIDEVLGELEKNGDNKEQTEQKSDTTDIPSDYFEGSMLQVHYIDVGQGDCTLLICDDEAMLIDAGDNSKGTAVQLYLNKRDVKKLKYMIVTHGDSDHCGGADVVITKFDVETLIMPKESKDTATYRDVLDAAKSKNLEVTRPEIGTAYTLGGASFVILAPGKEFKDSNNNSVAIMLTHGENTFLFTGDAEHESEELMLAGNLSLDADVYQAGHHGSNTASGREFLEAVTPEYCVISCGEGNKYGHPHAEIMINLREMGVKVFRTDEQGSIVAESDGKEIRWNMSPSESWYSPN